MCNLREIENRLRQDPSELRQQIVQDIGFFTVAVFGVFDGHAPLRLAGTGTLVTVMDSHYILTAAHVWEEVLRDSVQVGITLREHINQRFLIETAAISTSGPGRPNSWNEWGPDLILLRIPENYVGAINVHRVFYNLTRNRDAAPPVDSLEIYTLMGTPEAMGRFTENHADVEINGLFLQAEPTLQNHDEFDFLDFDADLSLAGVPRQFGGVSGGGLWRIRVFWSEDQTEIKWHKTLAGVAFHQLPVVNGSRIIRCHGEQSIQMAVELARQSA